MIRGIIFDCFGVLCLDSGTATTLNLPLVDYIKQDLKPHFKLAVLSNVGRGWIQDFFDEHQLQGTFDVVVLSSEEGITKPNPLIFERTAERLNVPPGECIMIDDRQDNCDSAKAVGMKSILFTSNNEAIAQLNALLLDKGGI